MQIKAVVPCVHYDDFLALTLPHNLAVMPSITVLTSPFDLPTIALAKKLGAQVVETRAWTIGGPFNKALALNQWVEHYVINPEQWLMVLDADILLPKQFPAELDPAMVDPRGLYTARRRMCEEMGAFQEFVDGRRTLEDFPLDEYPVEDGKLWGYYETRNTAGLAGYLQLWCPAHSVGMKRFPESGSAEGYDLEFALSFPEEHRRFLETSEVLHIGPSQVNWKGRKSPRWKLQS